MRYPQDKNVFFLNLGAATSCASNEADRTGKTHYIVILNHGWMEVHDTPEFGDARPVEPQEQR